MEIKSKSQARRIAMQTERKIVRNRCQCSVCKDIIESKHRHDFVQCKCGRIFTDGGTLYLHRGFIDPTDLIDLSEYMELDLDKLTVLAQSVPLGNDEAQPSVQADGFWACAECGYQNVNALDICTHCFNRRR